MEPQHITYFKVENFKRFDSFEMSNLGQFNLIVGDNNVGKTSVLEALCFDKNLVSWRGNLHSIIGYRGFYGDKKTVHQSYVRDAEIWNMFFKINKQPVKVYTNDDCEIPITLSLVTLEELSDTEKDIIKQRLINPVPQFWLRMKFDSDISIQLQPAYFEDGDFVGEEQYLPFIPANLSYGEDLVNYFYKYINVDKKLKKELENNLLTLIPKLEDIRVHRFSKSHEMLSIVLENSNNIFPLITFGDGSVKITRILLEILVSRNSRLMIDEIGNGIHFSRLKDYWKTILQLCAKYNVQLFATTHSLECQRAFVDALDDPDMQQYQKDARNITLLENKQGNVKAVTYDFEQFEYALTIGFNTRGGSQ